MSQCCKDGLESLARTNPEGRLFDGVKKDLALLEKGDKGPFPHLQRFIDYLSGLEKGSSPKRDAPRW